MKKRFTADLQQSFSLERTVKRGRGDVTFFSCSLKYIRWRCCLVKCRCWKGGVIVAKHVHILGSEVNIGVYFHSRNTGCALIQQLIC